MTTSINTRAAALAAARRFINDEMQPLVEQLKDTNIPLEDRWNAYLTLVENDVLTTIESYGDGFVEDLDSNWTLYDNFYIERYSVMLYPDMLDRVEDFDEEAVPDEAIINAWKEKVLASGKAGFCYDW